MAGAKKLSIIVVNYNTRELTGACLRSVIRETRERDFELIVLDNASDASWEEIEKEFPDVRLIISHTNLGFARANNVAARDAAGDMLLLLNPDTVVLDRGIDRLVNFSEAHPTAAIWGGRTVFADGSLNPKSCWRFMSLWSLLAQATGLAAVFAENEHINFEAYGGWNRDGIREVDFVSGCFFLIRRELWQRLGGFDERFFMYGEEADLCFRARELGARPLFTPDATVIHYGGASETARAAKIQKLFAGKLTFINKHWPGPKRAVAVHLLVFHALVRAAGYGVLASISGADKHRKCAQEWREVWRSREKWTSGYSRTGPAEVELGQV